jgi:hypothetical protein
MSFIVSSFTRIARSARAQSLATGVISGLFCGVWISQFVLAWGASAEVGSAIVMAVGAGALAVWAIPGRQRISGSPWRWLGPAVWAVFFPQLIQWTLGLAARQTWESLAQPRAVFGMSLTAALLTLSPATFLVLTLSKRNEAGVPSAAWWFGLSAALILAPVTVFTWFDPQSVALCAALICIASFVAALWRPSVEVQDVEGTDVEAVTTSIRWKDVAGLSAAAGAAGLAFAAISRLDSQLFLPVASLSFATWGGWACGIAVGVALVRRWRSSTSQAAASALLLIGGWLGIQVIGCETMMRFALWISAEVSSLPLIFGLRMLATACLFAPIGIALGRCLASHQGKIAHSWSPAIVAAWFTAGLATGGWITFNLAQFAALAGTFCGAGGLLSLAAWSRPQWSRRAGWTGAAAACAATAAAIHSPNLDRSGRILFSSTHFQAAASGYDLPLLSNLDDARLCWATQTPAATWTVWSQNAVQQRLLRNGIARGVISADPRICPQVATDVLTSLLPIALHSQPRRVLILSAECPVAVATVMALPIERIQCIDREPASLNWCYESLLALRPQYAQGDDRLSLRRVDPQFAVRAAHEAFDVIIAPQSDIASAAGASTLTTEHFGSIASLLSDEGLFCQRLTCVDLGAAATWPIIRSMQAAFPQVALFEASPGDWLLVGSREPLVIDETLVTKLETPHVREILAGAGWDWSIVMGLRFADSKTLAASTSQASADSVASAEQLFRTPLEVMRWGAKNVERRDWLAKVSAPMANRITETGVVTDISQRLSDVRLAQQILTDHPDQFWSYRHFVKKRLQDRPRSKVIQVKDEGLRHGLHPEDSRRKEYLKALGEAVNGSDMGAAADLLSGYSMPFDPLVSPFIAREAAEIEQRSGSVNYDLICRCWLTSVYYAPPSDHSVRNVCDGLMALVEHPEVGGDAETRWDRTNALMEALKQRWSLRRNTSGQLKFGVADAEATLQVAAEAIDELGKLRLSAGIDASDFEARKLVLERQLIQPVRAWRAQQSAYDAAQNVATAPRPKAPAVDAVEQADAEVESPETSPRRLTPEQTAARSLEGVK